MKELWEKEYVSCISKKLELSNALLEACSVWQVLKLLGMSALLLLYGKL